MDWLSVPFGQMLCFERVREIERVRAKSFDPKYRCTLFQILCLHNNKSILLKQT